MDFTLRKWRRSDASNVALYANDEAVGANLRDGFPYPYTIDDARGFIAFCLEADDETVVMRAIDVGGQAVGSIGVFVQTDVYRKSAEIGYWLARPFWGQGIMSRAVVQMCDIAFDRCDIVRLHAEVFSSNPASGKVLEKAGFAFEGIKRRSVFKRGKLMDSHIYALVRE